MFIIFVPYSLVQKPLRKFLLITSLAISGYHHHYHHRQPNMLALNAEMFCLYISFGNAGCWYLILASSWIENTGQLAAEDTSPFAFYKLWIWKSIFLFGNRDIFLINFFFNPYFFFKSRFICENLYSFVEIQISLWKSIFLFGNPDFPFRNLDFFL